MLEFYGRESEGSLGGIPCVGGNGRFRVVNRGDVPTKKVLDAF